MAVEHIAVIAIDGPSASGKGTVAQLVAQQLGFHYLNSGAIYRVAALAARRAGIALDDEAKLIHLAQGLDLRFAGEDILLNGESVTDALRSEQSGNDASKIAALPELRRALLGRQRAFRVAPGLVAEGRDMGSVVFPDASPKIFLTASMDARAQRRHKQLMGKGMCVNLSQILQELSERDARDRSRSVAPLQMCADASLLDTTSLSVEQAVAEVLRRYAEASRMASP